MKFEFDTSGLDKLEKNLDNLVNNADSIDGAHEVPLVELLNQSFMTKHSKFSNFEEFASQSRFDFSDFENIDVNQLDEYVKNHTSFTTWNNMINTAATSWTAQQLGF